MNTRVPEIPRDDERERALPQRPATHVLEEQSERFLRQHLPSEWTCERPAQDYGVDLRIDIFENGHATGLELIVQLKASEAARTQPTESASLRIATYNYLKSRLQLAMLVKFVAEENEAYWVLLRDIPEPDQRNDTFSVQIPKENRLSRIDWAEIGRMVRGITDAKLAVARRDELEHRSD